MARKKENSALHIINICIGAHGIGVLLDTSKCNNEDRTDCQLVGMKMKRG
jgi:hypothetical protein